MAITDYKQQTGGSLGGYSPCPPCGGGPGSNYLAEQCGTGTQYSVHPANACENGNGVILTWPLNSGDVVWLIANCGDPSSTIICAKIVGTTNLSPNRYVEMSSGSAPFASCPLCQVP